MVSAILEVQRDNHWEYVADLYHWSTKRPQEILKHALFYGCVNTHKCCLKG